MSWIGLTDMTSAAFNVRGLGVSADAPGARPAAGPHDILPTGTLMIEFRHDAAAPQPRPILSSRRYRALPRQNDATLSASGRLPFALRQGAQEQGQKRHGGDGGQRGDPLVQVARSTPDSETGGE